MSKHELSVLEGTAFEPKAVAVSKWWAGRGRGQYRYYRYQWL